MMVLVFVLFCCVAGVLSSSPEENLDVGRSGEDLFEGDIVLTLDQYLAIEGISRGSMNRGRWPNGVIPYEIDASLSGESRAMNAINAGLRAWESTTCLTFVKRTTEKNFISMFKGGGCWSYIGQIGGKQQLSLAPGCWSKGVVAHELGHALGFYHEQSRPDRDTYVTIMWNNIKSGKEGNFKKYSTNVVNTPYDYGSIMHYGKTYFTKNGKDTIVPKKAGASIGNRKDLTATDIQEMNLRYGCSGATAAPTTVPPPPPSNCKDRHSNCFNWKRAGYCKTYEQILRYYCKKTCEFC